MQYVLQIHLTSDVCPPLILRLGWRKLLLPAGGRLGGDFS